MLIGSLLRFSSHNDETKNDNNINEDDLMPKALSKKLASLYDQADRQTDSRSDNTHQDLDDLSEVMRTMLMDENLDASRLGPFIWTMVETYVDRFQVFPFDPDKLLLDYIESLEYPEEKMRELIKRLEKLYRIKHGGPVHEPEQLSGWREELGQGLDDEINELRETLKYAAIVGERLDGKE